MCADLQKGVTFTDGVSIANAANLNNLMDLGTILPAFISAKTDLPSPSTGCELVVNDAGTLKKVTVANLATVVMGGFTGQVHGKTAVTALTSLDEFLLWEDTAAAERKITYADVLTALKASLGLPVTILTGTATIDPPSINPDDDTTFNVTVTGASTTNTPTVFISPSIAYPNYTVISWARVSSANTVTFALRNTSETGSINIASHTVRATVFQY